jgi:hypothetical protein
MKIELFQPIIIHASGTALDAARSAPAATFTPSLAPISPPTTLNFFYAARL